MNFRPLFVDLKLDHYYPDKKKPGKNSCRKWYFPFPQFSPWSADWAWKRHKIGHLAGLGGNLQGGFSTTRLKLNPFHEPKLLMSVQCIPMEFNTFSDDQYLETMSYFVPQPTIRKRGCYKTFQIVLEGCGGRRAMCVISLPVKECSQLSQRPSMELVSLETRAVKDFNQIK